MSARRATPGAGRRRDARWRVGRWCVLALVAAVPLLGGCSSLSYYWQAGVGQWEIITHRRPITDVLNDESVAAETKRKLRLVLAAQDFATKALALPRQGHYRYYTDLGRPYVSWLVVAARPLALESRQFCYLIVGCLDYRGFFARADAEALADELSAADWDTLVRPVTAYSTLGWFDDPVLNTFLENPDVELIGTIFHEQAHRRFFLEGDTTFNESFATAVEEAGLQRYAAQPGVDGDLLARYRARRVDRERFLAIVLATRGKLAALYASDLADAAKRRRKAALFEAMREDYQRQRDSFKLLNYDRWFAQPLSNAHLVGLGQYHQYVGAFLALLAEQDGDFARFYEAVEALAKLPPAQREARLNSLAAHYREAERFVATATPTQ